MLVEGWHIRYLIVLVAASLFCSICVVSVTLVVAKDFNVSLTAGTYTLSFTSLILAVLTILSYLM